MFAYWFLKSEGERVLYDRLVREIGRRAEAIGLPAASEEEIACVIRAVLTDNPQLFWFEGRAAVDRDAERVLLQPVYLYDEDSIRRGQSQAERIAADLARLGSGGGYEGAKAAFDWLLDNVSYAPGAGGQNLYTALVERRAVCKGLSKAYQFLLSRLGLFSTLAYGTIDGAARHVWNVVQIGNDYYNVDVSLGYPLFDPLFKAGAGGDRYRTFLKSDASFGATHRLTDPEAPHLPCRKDYSREAE